MNSNALHINKIIINLIILARYRFHDKEIIRYIFATLIRIDLMKNVFQAFRFLNKITNKDYFNFLKFYNINYLFKIIRLFDLLNEYIIQMREKTHIEFLKNYYDRINKHDNYIEQIMRHDIRHINMIKMRDVVNYRDINVLLITR